MSINNKIKLLLLITVMLPSMLMASVPAEVSELVSEMKELGASCRGGVSKELGVFIVGIGRAKYRPGAINRCREVAEMNA